jgi:hypothetical protein
MIIRNKVKIRKKTYKKNGKQYVTYYVSLSSKLSKILEKFEKLRDVEIVTDKGKFMLPEVNLFVNTKRVNYKTMEKIPIYSFTIPKRIAKELVESGIKKVEVIVDMPNP